MHYQQETLIFSLSVREKVSVKFFMYSSIYFSVCRNCCLASKIARVCVVITGCNR